jgi:hypothetical protein
MKIYEMLCYAFLRLRFNFYSHHGKLYTVQYVYTFSTAMTEINNVFCGFLYLRMSFKKAIYILNCL